MKKKILITGNLGYVGTVLSKYIKYREPKTYIVGYDTGFFKDDLIVKKFNDDLYVDEQIYGDVRKFNYKNLSDIHSIIHLAAISNDPMGNLFEEETFNINCDSVIEISKRAIDCNIKNIVFASSCSIYGDGGNHIKNEKDLTNPLTSYAKSKIKAEEELVKLSGETNITILRFATACGSSPRLRLDLVLNDFVASALIKGEIIVLSDGSPLRPLVDVLDMSKSILWSISDSRIKENKILTINVGRDDANYSIKELAYNVQKIINTSKVKINTNASPDKRSYKVNFDYYKKLANNFQLETSLHKSINNLNNTIKPNLASLQDFRNNKFMRLNKLKFLLSEKKINNKLYWI